VSELPIPEQFETILMTCLEKDPGKRFSSALELDAQLARVPTTKPWTQERARTWWQTHAPDVLKEERP
jgi:hypothetical protein